MEILIFSLLGLVLLIKGADIFVDGAASLAFRLGVSRLAIGLTVVSMGTSAPELVVNLIAAFQGSSDIALGNIIGSNNANLLLILGVCAFLYPIHIARSTAWKEIPYSLLAVLMILGITHDVAFNPSWSSSIGRGDGLLLLSFFGLFLYYVFKMGKEPEESGAHIKQMSVLLSLGYIAAGILALAFGGKWFVKGAVALAHILGMSEAVIGLTVVAVGTSLPELAVSVAAAAKKHSDIVIGNVVGSNIFNIFWVLGLTAVIHPLTWNPQIAFDLGVCATATLLLFAFCFTGRKYCMEKWEGAFFVLLYAGYLAFLVMGEG